MKTINSIACAGGIAVAMLSSSLSIAGTVEQEAARNSKASSQVHRVSHALAGASSYQGASNAGYKWGRKGTSSQKAQSQWTQSPQQHGGNKWSNAKLNGNSSSPVYANTSGNRWGIRNYSEQAGNRWGIRNYSEQAGNRWGIR